MLETKEQKEVFFASLALMVVLVLVSYWHRRIPAPAQTGPTASTSAAVYDAYLASLKTDPQASQKLFQQVVSQSDIQKQVEQQLQSGQKIIAPAIDHSKIIISQDSGKQTVQRYLLALGKLADGFNTRVLPESGNLFNDNEDLNALQAAISENTALVDSLYGTPAPAEALALHKAALTVYESFLEILNLAKNYAQDPNADPWPGVYNHYAAINAQMAVVNSETTRLAGKYNLSQTPVYRENAQKPRSLPGIPTAQAQLFGGVPTLVIGDIPAAIEKAIKDALAAAFANFATHFLNNLISAIEKNYKISNFLYYTDALVSGQYVNDYLNKYIPDPVDRSMIKNFIPQINCGQAPDLKPILKAKADQYLGFDPQNLNPNDPNFYLKMAKVGDFLTSAQGWELYYQDLAQVAESQAEQSANQELLSPGLKVPRDLQSTQLATTLESIKGSMDAIFNAQLNLGVVNVDKIIGSIVSNITYNLFNNFVFKGAYVYKEQSTCVDIPQLSPITPGQNISYQAPPPVNAGQIQQQQCAALPRGCQLGP